MRYGFAVLYTALMLGANAALADTSALEALREGTMKKLRFVEPTAVTTQTFTDPEGTKHSLSQFEGKHIILNFWATWCAPCRKEMPMLSELQTEFGGEDFEVVTIATGRNELSGIRRLFDEIEVDNLPIFLDPRQKLSRDMGVLGLPVTLVIDPEGNEIARMIGDAEWNSDSAKAIIRGLIGETEG